MKRLAIAHIAAAIASAAAFSTAYAETGAPAPSQPLTVEAVNAPAKFDAKAKKTGPAILRAQIMLDRAYFSPGEIDGAYGSNMRQALSGFQAARKLPVTGKLDEATWNALNADNS
ncbi:MAG: peptidoglycan-binding domain-containing protein, partial [Telluria sp.]